MPKQLTFYGVLLGILLLSLVVGNAVAEGDYITPSLMLLATLGVAAIVVPGYGFFLAFGLLCPFAFPIPFVFRFPFVALMLGLCCVKFAISQGLTRGRFHYQLAANAAILILFGWVVLRYCMNPVMPGLAIGTGNAITGFRGYLNYGICLAIILTMPLFVRSRDDAVQLLRWLGYVAFFFALLFIPLTLSKSFGAARILGNLGLTVALFDNGWLRFVALPGFGLILLTLSLLPRVAPLRRWQRLLVLAVALLAIIMGGNRTSLGMAMVILLCVVFARRRVRLIAAAVFGIAATLAIFYLLGENMKFSRGVGFFRVLALVSPRAAERSEAAQTFIWRKLRWERAMADIRQQPWIGKGYGGLHAVFAYATGEDLEQNLIEIDVASGSIHNGYLAGARAFGIPFMVLFILIMATRIYRHGRESIRWREAEPVLSELNSFLFTMLSALTVSIYFGTDVNGPEIWFYLSLGFVISSLTPAQAGARNEQSRQRLPAPVPRTVRANSFVR